MARRMRSSSSDWIRTAFVCPSIIFGWNKSFEISSRTPWRPVLCHRGSPFAAKTIRQTACSGHCLRQRARFENASTLAAFLSRSYTTKTQGTGLGLSIVRRIVEATEGISRLETIRMREPASKWNFPQCSIGGAPALGNVKTMDNERIYRRYREFRTTSDGPTMTPSRVRKAGRLVKSHLPALIDDFYSEIKRHPEAHKVFADEAQVERLKVSLKNWLLPTV